MTARILIIETDPRFRASLTEHLEAHGHAVASAEGWLGAETVLAAGGVRVVLLGFGGGPGVGLELLSRLRELYPELKVLLMVPEGEVGLSMEGMRRGAFDDVMVPFDLGHLLARVEAALSAAAQDGCMGPAAGCD